MKRIFFLLCLFLTALSSQAGLFSNQPRFLPANEAFVFSFNQQNQQLWLNWQIAKGYYLYQKELQFVLSDNQSIAVELPQAEPYQDEFFGTVNIYRDQLQIPIPLQKLANQTQLEVIYQGCTTGFCYPPESQLIDLKTLVQPSDVQTEKTPQKSTALSMTNEQSPPYAIWWFFLFGLGLAFTPCVLPMLPLLSAIVIGAEQRPNTLRAFALSFTYVQGMALTYTLLGLIVATVGLPFQVALQSPYVLLTLSVLFVGLALSMFGLFNLQLPTAWQTKLNQYSQQQKSGAFGSVFVMGMIAGLVASPCTSAPLSAALLYVAQSGDVVKGAVTLYLLALGMGVPLMLITLFGNKILPKSGSWMIQVKQAFGFVLLALPIFLISRVFPHIEMSLWFCLAFAFALWLLYQFKHYKWVWIFAFIIGVVAHWFYQHSTYFNHQSAVQNGVVLSPHFQRIHSYAELQQVLQQNTKPIVMLDLYADWCVACKEFEKYTFSDEKVRSIFDKILLLQIDMTKNSEQNTELMQKLQVIGLPTLIFFDAQGNEIPQSRITGFMAAEPFAQKLMALLQ